MSYRRPLALVIASICGCATAGNPNEGIDAPPGDGGGGDARVDASSSDASCNPVQVELLTNEAFDGTPLATGWTEARIDPAYPIVGAAGGAPAVSAPNRAWLGGLVRPAASNKDSLTQDVTVPANATALVLTGSYRVTSAELLPGSYDIGSIALTSTTNNPIETVAALDNDDEGATWTPFMRSFASAHAGQTVRVRMTSEGDDSFATSFFFDSLSLKATVPASGCP